MCISNRNLKFKHICQEMDKNNTVWKLKKNKIKHGGIKNGTLFKVVKLGQYSEREFMDYTTSYGHKTLDILMQGTWT